MITRLLLILYEVKNHQQVRRSDAGFDARERLGRHFGLEGLSCQEAKIAGDYESNVEQTQIRAAFGDGWSGGHAFTQRKPRREGSCFCASGPNLYEAIGVRPLINAKGTYTIISGSLSLPEVKQAMEEAGRHYVNMDELMAAVGARLAAITGAEWGS